MTSGAVTTANGVSTVTFTSTTNADLAALTIAGTATGTSVTKTVDGVATVAATGKGGIANGIVLIDEVDMHLHPTWQRTLVARLTKTFPHCQFVLTTHSPLVISEDLDVNDGEWVLIGDLFALYVERAAASLVEMSRGSGLDQYCRSVTEIEGDIRAMHDDFPRRVFCIPVQTFA